MSKQRQSCDVDWQAVRWHRAMAHSCTDGHGGEVRVVGLAVIHEAFDFNPMLMEFSTLPLDNLLEIAQHLENQRITGRWCKVVLLGECVLLDNASLLLEREIIKHEDLDLALDFARIWGHDEDTRSLLPLWLWWSCNNLVKLYRKPSDAIPWSC